MTTSTPSTARGTVARRHAGRHWRISRARTISRIAAGIDGFPEGQDAAALGQLLAAATGAELMLVAVHDQPMLPAPPELSYRSLRKETQRVVREVRNSLAPGARTVTASDISVPRALHRVVQRHHRDLLVVGSSRRGPEGRVRIGKRTRQLLGQFECALAVAPRGLHRRSADLHRIAVGYDGGPESDAALALARSIAAGAGAELHVLSVVDDRLPAIARPPLDGALAVEWEEVIQAEVDELRRRATDAGRLSGTEPDVAVVRGRPADVLLTLTETVDLLVIGSRRWGPAARVLLGTTGEALMHDAACAVLAVPRPRSHARTTRD